MIQISTLTVEVLMGFCFVFVEYTKQLIYKQMEAGLQRSCLQPLMRARLIAQLDADWRPWSSPGFICSQSTL